VEDVFRDLPKQKGPRPAFAHITPLSRPRAQDEEADFRIDGDVVARKVRKAKLLRECFRHGRVEHCHAAEPPDGRDDRRVWRALGRRAFGEAWKFIPRDQIKHGQVGERRDAVNPYNVAVDDNDWVTGFRVGAFDLVQARPPNEKLLATRAVTLPQVKTRYDGKGLLCFGTIGKWHRRREGFMAMVTLTIDLPDIEAEALAMLIASLGDEQFEDAYQHWLSHWKAHATYSRRSR
jgi:hypothetical protein